MTTSRMIARVLTATVLLAAAYAELSAAEDWGFHPPKRPAVPAPLRPRLGNHPIDSFLPAHRRTEGRAAAPQPPRRRLVRGARPRRGGPAPAAGRGRRFRPRRGAGRVQGAVRWFTHPPPLGGARGPPLARRRPLRRLRR